MFGPRACAEVGNRPGFGVGGVYRQNLGKHAFHLLFSHQLAEKSPFSPLEGEGGNVKKDTPPPPPEPAGIIPLNTAGPTISFYNRTEFNFFFFFLILL